MSSNLKVQVAADARYAQSHELKRVRLGYACVNLSLGEHGRTSRTCRLSNATRDNLETLSRVNLKGLLEILRWNASQRIKFYRISSGIIPLASHPEAQWPWRSTLRHELLKIGRFIKAGELRVSMHPGQYTVLNSPHTSIGRAAKAELCYHADFLDRLQLDSTHKIALHVGGVYGDRSASLQRFRRQFQTLPDNVRSRLVLENDERSYGAEDVLALGEALGIPMVFDHLHHLSQAGRPPTNRLLARIFESWLKSDGPPEVHYSTQKAGSRPGSHSDMVDPREFVRFLQLLPRTDVDIMLEAKSKDLALLSLRRKLTAYSQSLKGWVVT